MFWPASIFTLLRRRRHFVRQTGQTDCGVACALTVSGMMGRPTDAVEATEALDPDRTGASLEGLRAYFDGQPGISARAVSAPAGQLGKLRGQVILHMQQQHYVVLLHRSGHGVFCFDPAVGPVFYPAADFEALYSGHALEIRREKGGATLPATVRSVEPENRKATRGGGIGLFILGMANRLLEISLVMALCLMLYLVLNRSSTQAILSGVGILVLSGALLLVARGQKFDGEDAKARKGQSRLWRGYLRTALRGQDLHGFRGRQEREVAGAVRRGLFVGLPRRAQLPGVLGGFVVMPVLLAFLHPALSLAYALAWAAVLLLSVLDGIQVCRRSVRAGIGRYAPLTRGNTVLSAKTAPNIVGEAAKWSVIGVAGWLVLQGNLPVVSLMFWILAGVQIVPNDMRSALVLAPALDEATPVPDLTSATVPLRRQTLVASPDLKLARQDGLLQIEGIKPLTMTLQQPDLTVREQRQILAGIVYETLRSLPEKDRPDTGSIRLFAPGQEVSQADFDQLVLRREAQGGAAQLPVPVDGRTLRDQAAADPILRALLSCDVQDFPVFWDLRGQLKLPELQKRVAHAGLARAGHLTMTRLTVLEAA